jgi:hypothetical protein
LEVIVGRQRTRQVRVSRTFDRGVVVAVRELRESDEFVTLLTRRSGIVLERRHDGVLVDLQGDIERRIHPQVRVEVA